MAARWIEAADRKTSCARCRRPIEVGERFYYQRRGTYLCEMDGSMAEHEEPEVGDIESGVMEDLKQLPPEAADRTVAKLMIDTAQRIDRGEVADRDVAPLIKELRTLLLQLKEQFPPEPEDDDTARARKRREERLIRGSEF